MASIIAANGDNGAVGIDGIMWGAQVIPCKVGGGNSGSLGQARKCLEWIERLIDEEQLRIVAINVSFGSDCCDCEMERVVGRLRERGVLLIAAAGNGRKSNDGDNGCSFYPASIPLSNVVSVTGSDTYGNVLYRYGKRRVHVAAPGVNIPVLVPGGGRSMIPGGASAAAAHATGVVALLYAQNPSRPWWELRNLLLSGGIPVSCANDPACALVTGRQLRAWGSGGTGALNCAGQAVRRRLLPVEDRLQRRPGDVVLLRVLSVTCALAQPPPLVRVRPAVDPSTVLAELQLRDDGVAPDEVANDGEYHASWVVPGPSGRDYVLSVADEPVEVHVEEP
jgi:subtilisin family serine protease